MKTLFGDILKKVRETREMSKRALAQRIGTSDAYIRQIENQKLTPPTFKRCQEICNALKLDPFDETALLKAAFNERIVNEQPFLNHLNKGLPFDVSAIKTCVIELAINSPSHRLIRYHHTLIKTILLETFEKYLQPPTNTYVCNCIFAIELDIQFDNGHLNNLSSILNESSDIISQHILAFQAQDNLWKPTVCIKSRDVTSDGITTIRFYNLNWQTGTIHTLLKDNDNIPPFLNMGLYCGCR